MSVLPSMVVVFHDCLARNFMLLPAVKVGLLYHCRVRRHVGHFTSLKTEKKISTKFIGFSFCAYRTVELPVDVSVS